MFPAALLNPKRKAPPEAKKSTSLQLDEGVTLADRLDELGVERKIVICVNTGCL